MHRIRIRMSAAILVALLAGAATAEEWPNFRGPNYDGISSETGLKVKWDQPMPLVWERDDIGPAYSSFAIVAGKVYTCGQHGGKQTVDCLDAKTGKTIWSTGFAAAYNDMQGDGPRATPTVADGRVYILGSKGRFVCLDAESGNELWSKQFDNTPQWGYSSSALVTGDMVITIGGKGQGTLVALDRKSGKPIWTCGEDDAGYATPYPFEFNGKPYIVGFAGTSAIIAERDTGKQVFQFPWETSYKVNAAAPIFNDGYLLLTSGYTQGSVLLKLRADGDRLAADKIWQTKVLLNKFQSCILKDGYLYASDQKGLKCVEFLTGSPMWEVRREANGTIVLAQDHLFVLAEDGKLMIAPVSPQEFKPVTQAEIMSGPRCWTVPVISGGKLYVRNMARVACFDLTGS